MRVVVDTNVIVSALLSPHGIPSQIFRFWEMHTFDILVSEKSLEELTRVLHYPKIHKRLRSTEEELAEFVNIFREKALWITRMETIYAITEDVSDNLYLEIGLAGHARYIISGDQHLLRLKNYQGISVITPKEFLAHLDSPPATD